MSEQAITNGVEIPAEHVDVLIVGAGLSGIGAAHHLQERCPGKSYAILEAREVSGGTWDLFRYPGIRSDSDMHTLGYRFRPWTDAKSIAEGSKILNYVRDTASEGGIDRHIRFNHRVVSAAWSSEDARWTVEAERADTGETVSLTCGFLFMNTGYYRYDEGYTPDFPGIDSFAGEVVHPQHWPENLDYAGKRVVVIGSGATAMTLVPAMARDAAQVTMLQRSPTYVISMPGEDGLANRLRRHLPDRAAYPIVRWKNVLLQGAFYRLSRKRPALIKKLLRRGAIKALPPGYDVDTHFKPHYNPWDQRVCLVPDADLFRALGNGSAESGIELESGAKLEADVVITATGLNLLFLGGMKITIDGAEPDLPRALTYKGMMLSDFPNFAYTLGYTNASWTLKADLTSEYICRLLNHMDATGCRIATPTVSDPSITDEPLLDFNSGYVLRSIEHLPKQGSKEPWKLRQNYPVDLRMLRRGPVDDGTMKFSSPAPRPQSEAATQALASSS
jgi:cation diffusion facilitator CzcD-associated flavoprotein CzcO